MTVLAVIGGVILCIPAALAALQLVAWGVFSLLAGALPNWLESLLLWGSIVGAAVGGAALILWGVK